jgi:hypothetical protein
MPTPRAQSSPVLKTATAWFTGIFGLFLGLGLLKLGNPIILNSLIDLSPGQITRLPPGFLSDMALAGSEPTHVTVYEWLIQPWPLTRGLWCLAFLVAGALPLIKWRSFSPKSLLIPVALWITWQCIATFYSVKVELSELTVGHFLACLACALIGWGILSQYQGAGWFWGGLALGYLIVLWHGLGQHYGGLEAVRQQIYEYPDWKNLPPEVLKRFTSNRIFSTLVYPNALAGIILLVFPPLLVTVWVTIARLGNIGRGIVTGLFIYANLACLVWSGSKTGWLIGMTILVVFLVNGPLPKKIKWITIMAILGVGLFGFAVRYSGYFARGATSASARLDYWQAAFRIAWVHPWFGTGPGTFSVPYSQIKAPKSEMAKLVHNDYLEQASDSGWLAFLSYCGFIWGSIYVVYRYSKENRNNLYLAIFLGFLAWSLQGFMEFGLYIPASSWLAFTFLGWLIGKPQTE